MPALHRRLCAAFAAAVVLVVGCGSAADATLPDVDARLLVVDPTTGTAAEGEAVALDAIEGPAVVNVWATTCAPCVKEMPTLQSIAVDHPDVAFFGLNVAESPDTVAAFVDRVGVTYPQLLDPAGIAQEALEIDSLPTTIVIGADGVITKRHRGEITADDLVAALPGST